MTSLKSDSNVWKYHSFCSLFGASLVVMPAVSVLCCHGGWLLRWLAVTVVGCHGTLLSWCFALSTRIKACMVINRKNRCIKLADFIRYLVCEMHKSDFFSTVVWPSLHKVLPEGKTGFVWVQTPTLRAFCAIYAGNFVRRRVSSW